MCEAIVFLVTQTAEKELMRDVLTLEAQDDHFLLTNFLGEQKEVRAKLKSISFSQHMVILEEV